MFSEVWGHLGAPNTAKQEEKETKTKGNRQGEKKERKKEDQRTPVLLGSTRMGTLLRDRNLRQASLMVANY